MSVAMVFEGLELLSQDQILGLRDMVQGAINVMLEHRNDPERGDIGWRKQTLEIHLEHARVHALEAKCAHTFNRVFWPGHEIDNDGLPHVDHAAARIALYYARKLALKEQDASGD